MLLLNSMVPNFSYSPHIQSTHCQRELDNIFMYLVYMGHISSSPPKARRDGNWPELQSQRSVSCINLRNTVVKPDSYTIFSDGNLAGEI